MGPFLLYTVNQINIVESKQGVTPNGTSTKRTKDTRVRIKIRII
jgi:hypothetical protein